MRGGLGLRGTIGEEEITDCDATASVTDRDRDRDGSREKQRQQKSDHSYTVQHDQKSATKGVWNATRCDGRTHQALLRVRDHPRPPRE